MDPGLSLDYVTTVLAALLVGAGFVLQQRAAAMQPASRFPSIRLIIDLFRKPRWLAGIGLLAAGDILAARSIGHLELSSVEPLLTTYLIFALQARRVNCSTACSTAAAHCPGDWGTMTCASCSTDASRYWSWLAPLPAPSCAGSGGGRGDGQTGRG